MEIILIQAVKNLGTEGDVITVADGYGRNFLIPQGMAIPANKSNMKRIDDIKRRQRTRELKELEQAKKVAEQLLSVSCTIPVQAGEEDKLFGSVTSQDIARALEKEGMEIDRRKIVLEEPIKELGVFTVNVKLHSEVTGTLKVWVVKE